VRACVRACVRAYAYVCIYIYGILRLVSSKFAFHVPYVCITFWCAKKSFARVETELNRVEKFNRLLIRLLGAILTDDWF